jgi:putative flippase GtrA
MLKFISKRFVKFLFVGGLNTLFGFLIYSLLAITELPTWLVLLIANLLGIIFNFFTTGGLVFKSLSITKVPVFIICYGIVFLLNLGLLYWLTSIFDSRIWAMAIVIMPMAILTYLMQSRFVFCD